MKLNNLLDNTITIPNNTEFAAIIGSNPSSGARSPLLWNAAFKAHGLDSRMFPMDVSLKNLEHLLDKLNSNSKFMGGAIAVPYKESVAQWLSNQGKLSISTEASAIGAVNCLYRNNEGHLCGTNTDGEGALASLRAKYPNLTGKKVLQIGAGGAGKAVATYIASSLGRGGQLTISVRNKGKVTSFADRINAELTNWPPDTRYLSDIDILINCSTIGSNTIQYIDGQYLNMSEYSPLASLGDTNSEKAAINVLRNKTIVFDIIYDPMPTRLLALCFDNGNSILDGSTMNLEQAIIAFSYATNNTDGKPLTRQAMKNILNRQ